MTTKNYDDVDRSCPINTHAVVAYQALRCPTGIRSLFNRKISKSIKKKKKKMKLRFSSSHDERTTWLRALMLPSMLFLSTRKRTGLLDILIVLCSAPMTSATFWSSMSYVAGEDFSLARRAKRQQQQRVSQQLQQPLSTQSQATRNDNVQIQQQKAVPSAIPRMIVDTTTTDKAAKQQAPRQQQEQEKKKKQKIQEETVVQQQIKDSQGQEACTGSGDVPVDTDVTSNTAATFIVQKVQQLATNKATTTTANALSEPTTLDTVPVAKSSSIASSDSKNASDDSSSQTSSIIQQPKVVSPAGVTRFILVSAVVALSLLNIHLYISL